MSKGKKKNSWQPHKSIGGLLIAIGSKMAKQGQDYLTQAKLSHLSGRRITVMSLLCQQPNTQAQLSVALKISQPSAKELLGKMQKEGIVKKIKKNNCVLWMITASGCRDIQKAERIFKKHGHKVDDFFKRNKIGTQEVNRFREILQLMLDDHQRRMTV